MIKGAFEHRLGMINHYVCLNFTTKVVSYLLSKVKREHVKDKGLKKEILVRQITQNISVNIRKK